MGNTPPKYIYCYRRNSLSLSYWSVAFFREAWNLGATEGDSLGFIFNLFSSLFQCFLSRDVVYAQGALFPVFWSEPRPPPPLPRHFLSGLGSDWFCGYWTCSWFGSGCCLADWDHGVLWFGSWIIGEPQPPPPNNVSPAISSLVAIALWE